jgi:parallel beta-helix repeat protein
LNSSPPLDAIALMRKAGKDKYLELRSRQIMKLISGAFLLIILLSSTSSFATTWYVNGTSGNDHNDGRSLTTAFRTPQHAANITVPGDTVDLLGKFGGGTSGIAPLVIRTSGTPGQPITYQSYYNGMTGPRAVITGTRALGAIQGSYPLSYITINDLEIVGWTGSLSWAGASANYAASGTGWQASAYIGEGIFFGGGVGGQTLHHITVTNCVVHDFPGGGIALTYNDYATVSNNTVYNNSKYSPWQTSGISLYALHNIDKSNATKNIVSGNTVYANANQIPTRLINVITTTATAPAPAGATAISVASSTNTNYTMRVIDSTSGAIAPGTYIYYYSGIGNNTINLAGGTVTGSGVHNGDTIAFQYITDGEGIIIDNNTNSQTDNIPYVGRTLITNNVVFNNGSACIAASPGTNNVDVTFNTCYHNQTSNQNLGINASSEFDDRGTNGTNVYNNIFDAINTVPSVWDQSAGTTTFENNLFYGGIAGHDFPGSNNVLTNPEFINPSWNLAIANFQLKLGSPAIDAGNNAFTRTIDHFGNPGLAGRTYDIGAFEFPTP